MPETYGATALTAVLTPMVEEDVTDDEAMFVDEVASLVAIATFEERFRKKVVRYAGTIEDIARERVVLADPTGAAARKRYSWRFITDDDSNVEVEITDPDKIADIGAKIADDVAASIAGSELYLKALRYRFPGIADAASRYAESE